MMNQKRRWVDYKPLLWVLAIPILNIFYGLTNHPGPGIHFLATTLDEQTPFIPAFIVPYISWYPFMIITLLLIFRKNLQVYYQAMLALCCGLILSYLVYFCFQTMVLRPPVEESGILNMLVRFVYDTDQPYNCFPSIHVFTSCVMYRYASIFATRGRIFVKGLAILIIFSTLFVKQHVIADVVGGWILAETMVRCAGWCYSLFMKSSLRNKGRNSQQVSKS
ncbi:inositol phosphorylceramide synthase [Paenibacillus selenitireducens]|uniref:Inositol phosphorylceramide synthase n=1 Tax=Paenibacillus selenitireducens TaxID=1324314 RepID=A0A1T2X111_9BACL|nr:phosphatase PAP2 family protein [Paenibacillus selenitireducens]OPA73396.1 inositol phosphorylceramide synthase [Paenibacillus selenitireducens]